MIAPTSFLQEWRRISNDTLDASTTSTSFWLLQISKISNQNRNNKSQQNCLRFANRWKNAKVKIFTLSYMS